MYMCMCVRVCVCVFVYFKGEHAYVIDEQYRIIGIIKIQIPYYSIVSLLKINNVALRKQNVHYIFCNYRHYPMELV